MDFLKRAINKDSYAFGTLAGLVLPVLFLFLIIFLMRVLALFFPVPVYHYEKYYLLSLSANLLLMRYYLVGIKYVKTGKGILAVTFVLMLLIFVFG